jgi:hypothetical protein
MVKEARAKLRDVGDKSMEDMIHMANSVNLDVQLPQASFREALHKKFPDRGQPNALIIVHRLLGKSADVGSISGLGRFLIGGAQQITLPSGDGSAGTMRLVHSFEVKTPHASISSIYHVDSDLENVCVL